MFDSKGSVTLFHKYCFPNLHSIYLLSITKWLTKGQQLIYNIPSTIASTVSPSRKRFTKREALPLMSSRESLW